MGLHPKIPTPPLSSTNYIKFGQYKRRVYKNREILHTNISSLLTLKKGFYVGKFLCKYVSSFAISVKYLNHRSCPGVETNLVLGSLEGGTRSPRVVYVVGTGEEWKGGGEGTVPRYRPVDS